VQYMLLIYNDENAWASMPKHEREPIIQEYFALTNELHESGAYVAGAPLRPTTTATTVRIVDDEPVVTDGPFAETKEQLGGYFLVDVESVDEALEWAGKIPAARYGSIEVRPVLPVGAEAAAG
jgi:hypothetical protein